MEKMHITRKSRLKRRATLVNGNYDFYSGGTLSYRMRVGGDVIMYIPLFPTIGGLRYAKIHTDRSGTIMNCLTTVNAYDVENLEEDNFTLLTQHNFK